MAVYQRAQRHPSGDGIDNIVEPLAIGWIVFAWSSVAPCSRMCVHNVLPGHHLSAESKDVVGALCVCAPSVADTLFSKIIINVLTISGGSVMTTLIAYLNENLMTIMISSVTVSSKAAANAVIGALTLYDATGTARGSNFTLDTDAAGFFGISGNNLIALRTSLPVGFYGVHVSGNAQYVAQTDEAYFVIAVTAT